MLWLFQSASSHADDDDLVRFDQTSCYSGRESGKCGSCSRFCQYTCRTGKYLDRLEHRLIGDSNKPSSRVADIFQGQSPANRCVDRNTICDGARRLPISGCRWFIVLPGALQGLTPLGLYTDKARQSLRHATCDQLTEPFDLCAQRQSITNWHNDDIGQAASELLPNFKCHRLFGLKGKRIHACVAVIPSKDLCGLARKHKSCFVSLRNPKHRCPRQQHESEFRIRDAGGNENNRIDTGSSSSYSQ